MGCYIRSVFVLSRGLNFGAALLGDEGAHSRPPPSRTRGPTLAPTNNLQEQRELEFLGADEGRARAHCDELGTAPIPELERRSPADGCVANSPSGL